ncbi:MAG: hypothetical protein FJ030_06290 [Chloroflexi bacterium]|nr:hypothetical protein [Chloroflexota bacterium]
MPSLRPILSSPPIDRIRRNHGLEHATIHVLSSSKRKTMAGYSDTKGFWLVGDLNTEDVAAGVSDALARMKNGEPELAVHPGCGTNYVTAGAFAALAAFLAFFGAKTWREKLERLPLAMALITGAIIFSQPVGMKLQAEITTDGHVRDLEVASVKKVSDSPLVMHRIETRG